MKRKPHCQPTSNPDVEAFRQFERLMQEKSGGISNDQRISEVLVRKALDDDRFAAILAEAKEAEPLWQRAKKALEVVPEENWYPLIMGGVLKPPKAVDFNWVSANYETFSLEELRWLRDLAAEEIGLLPLGTTKRPEPHEADYCGEGWSWEWKRKLLPTDSA